MLFCSWTFARFFAVVFAVYLLLTRRLRAALGNSARFGHERLVRLRLRGFERGEVRGRIELRQFFLPRR